MSLSNRLTTLLAALTMGVASIATAQGTATVRGTVTRAGGQDPLVGVQVSVRGTTLSTITNAEGRYTLYQVPTGPQTIVFRWLGYAPVDQATTVNDGVVVNVAMEPKAISLADITVTAASREPERIVEAPAAVTSIEPYVLQTTAPTGQAPLALASSPGVDLVQSGINDFNINARGFNSSLNRRVLTLLDGRDLAIAFLGSQEWSALPASTDGLKVMELVRGPGSALYGPNAFAGVLNMTTLSPREAPGGQISVAGGELKSFRSDARWAGVFGDGAWGVRVTGGFGTNDTWTRSRTGGAGLDLRREYAPALGADSMETPVMSRPEARPLNGQTLDPATREAVGDRDPIKTMYGTARLDRYLPNGAVITAEGGASQSENETLVTGIGRVQVIRGFKPYARLAFNSDHLNVFGYLNRRDSKDPQYSLASGAPLIEKSNIYHVEAQANTRFADQKARVVGGASFRQYNVNTEGTLMRPEDDDRHDKAYAAYGQAEYKLNEQVRLVAAARYDKGDLFEGQFSPKGGVVFSPNPNHSFRATVNRAFQTPNYSEFYLRAAAAPPANLSALEAGLRASALGPALAGVPNGQLFTSSATVPIYARGNADLKVEKVTGYELGYKGVINDRVFVTVDAYMSTLKDFVTDLLPGVNPAFAYWTAPAAVPAQYQATLVQQVKNALGASPATALAAAGLTRTEDGNTAIVLSYTNAGKVNQNGVDVGVGIQLTPEVRLDGSFSFFHFTVKDSLTGDKLVPNTPKTKGTITLAYHGHNGVDASLATRIVSGYDWSAGVFSGRIPGSQTVNLSLGYQIRPRYRIFTDVTNVLDQKRFQLYGGAVIGRRALAGLAASF